MLATFKSWNSYPAFARAVRYASRFLHDEGVIDFLQAVADSTAKRCSVISTKKVLWRAQIGHEWQQRTQDGDIWDEPAPFHEDRMKPLRHSAKEGRVNPKGIPCLYTASNKETAVAEVRPWLGALVSVAQMRATRELRFVTCSDGHDSGFHVYFEEPPPEEREYVVWREIGKAFSSPASPDPGIAEYVSTQVLSEQFRKNGYDGVAYQSKLGSGLNLALFDLDALEVIDVRLYPVKAVHCEIGDLQSSYVIKHK